MKGFSFLIFMLVFLFGVQSAGAEVFSIVAYSDTQKYTTQHPSIFTDQIQFTVENRVSRNIKFATHLGDMVNDFSDVSQWYSARDAMYLLDNAGIPYGTAPGDGDLGRDPAGYTYRQLFGPRHFTGKDWYGGASPSGLSSYQTFTAGGYSFLALHLDMETPQTEIDWAQDVLRAHPDMPTFIATHRYLSTTGHDNASRLYSDGKTADYLFNSLITTNPQVFMVLSGHNAGEYQQVSTNSRGQPVCELLTDYKNLFRGGNGYMRIITIDTEQDRVDVQTYSPTLNQYRTESNSQFTMPMDIDKYVIAPEPSVLLMIFFGSGLFFARRRR